MMQDEAFSDKPDLDRPHVATTRLRRLAAVLDDLGIKGVVRQVSGWPVLFVCHSGAAPFVISAGATHFWVGDPPELIGPNTRPFEAAWVVSERLGMRP
jgi:hypothetical protein